MVQLSDMTGNEVDPAAPLLLFDSGVGGLSVLAEVRRVLPEAPVIYAADLAGLPYGTKSEAEVAARVCGLLGRMAERFRPRLICIACNTASTIALAMVRDVLEVPIVGTVPAIKPAAEITRSGVIGLLGTAATIRQGYVDRLEAEFAADKRLLRHAAPELVEAAEAYLRGQSVDQAVFTRAAAGLRNLPGGNDIDTVVLACTHFPLVQAQLAEAFGPGVRFVDGAAGIARRVAWLTRDQRFQRDQPDFALFTGKIDPFPALGPAFAQVGISAQSAIASVMTKRLNFFLFLLLMVIGLPFYWLLVDTSPWNVAPQPVGIAQLRSLAGAIPGSKPVRVEMEMVGYRLLPGDLLAAGSGIKRRTAGMMAFILPVNGQGAVVIETGMTAALAAAMGSRFDPVAQARVDEQMRKASLILVTHEHGDHLGGLAALARSQDGLQMLTKTRLNLWQVPQRDADHALGWPAQMSIAPSISGIRPQAVAPGVVVIPAPSHTPGSQMFFVQLAGGAEYLFTGDIASLAVNWKEQRPRSRLLTDYLTPEDRTATLSWLATIAGLKQAAPGLRVIASHDYDWMVDPDRHSGVLHIDAVVTNNPAGN